MDLKAVIMKLRALNKIIHILQRKQQAQVEINKCAVTDIDLHSTTFSIHNFHT